MRRPGRQPSATHLLVHRPRRVQLLPEACPPDPRHVQRAVDRGIEADDMGSLRLWALAIAVAAVVVGTFTGIRRYLAFREGRPGVVVGEDGWLFSKEEFEAPLKRTPDLAEAAAGVTEVRDQLAAKCIELVVVPLPAKADIYREHGRYPAIPTDLERLYEVLRDAGVRAWQVQITAPLGRAADRPEMLLQPYDLLEVVPRIAALKRRGLAEGLLIMPGNNLGFFGPE